MINVLAKSILTHSLSMLSGMFSISDLILSRRTLFSVMKSIQLDEDQSSNLDRTDRIQLHETVTFHPMTESLPKLTP